MQGEFEGQGWEFWGGKDKDGDFGGGKDRNWGGSLRGNDGSWKGVLGEKDGAGGEIWEARMEVRRGLGGQGWGFCGERMGILRGKDEDFGWQGRLGAGGGVCGARMGAERGF